MAPQETAEHAGRVALVTGASSGIGAASAHLLAARGAAVGVNSVDAAGVEQVVAEITAAGGRALAVAGDVGDPAAMEAAVTATVAAFGRLDVLVTAAGIQRYGTVVTTTDEVWDDVFRVNVKGVFLAARAALPHLRAAGAGSVVVVSSVQALVAQTDVAAYAAGKGALLTLARAMVVDEAAHGVRVNTVLPGSVDTPMLRASAAMFSDGTPGAVESTLRAWGSSHPLGRRIARAAEVAEVVAFLAGPRASFVTGAEIRVDGGLLSVLAAALPDAAASAG